MGRKKINKANDAFGLKKSKEQSNKNANSFGNNCTNHSNNTAVLNTFLQQLKVKSIQNKQPVK